MYSINLSFLMSLLGALILISCSEGQFGTDTSFGGKKNVAPGDPNQFEDGGSVDGGPDDGGDVNFNTGGTSIDFSDPKHQLSNDEIEATPNGVVLNDGSVLVVKLGVNFEDSTDMDHNDAVLCFSGRFVVKDRDVTSTLDQTVSASTYNISAYHHYMKVNITNPDGTSNELLIDAKKTEPTSLQFKKGSKLLTYMLDEDPSNLQQGKQTMDGATPHTDKIMAEVLLNKCNDSGT